MEKSDGTMLCQSACTASISFTAIELDTHDLRAWGPAWDPPPGTDKPMVADGRFSDASISKPVGGAITDGASPVLLRLRGPGSGGSGSGGLSSPLNQLEIGIYHQMRVSLPGAIQTILPRRFLPEVGGLLAVASSGSGAMTLPFSLPVVDTPPAPFPPTGMDVRQPVGTGGLLFYVPPEAFVDPRFVAPMGPSAAGAGEALPPRNSLSSFETGPILFAAKLGQNFVPGTRRFLLRRPPIVLVHGITSSPATWDTVLWTEPSMPIPTRIYKVDYTVTNAKGYSENYPVLARAIEAALDEYRGANDAGHNPNVVFRGIHYAATRADVVGHSMGGQLARFYVADGMPPLIDRVGYVENALNHRSETFTDGRWPYLRSANWGAGSIRRLITLGSPFKGSPLANLASSVIAPGDAGPQRPTNGFTALCLLEDDGILPSSFEKILFPGGGLDKWREPTGVSDLEVGSAVQLALEGATYPSSQKRIAWYPIVGIAGAGIDDDPAQGLAWEVLLGFLPLVNDTEDFDNPLNPETSDLTVAANSQRNWDGSVNHPNGIAGMDFEGTAHSPRFGLPGETTSAPIADWVGKLLSVPSTWFPSNWRLGQ